MVDNNTPRPDGQGTFNISNTSPAISGSWIVFYNANDSLWSYNIVTGKFAKLADTSTPVPGGTGNFTSFPVCDSGGEAALYVSGGTVLFFGSDANAPAFCSGGYYTVPVIGGKVSKMIDYNTVLPGGGTFFVPTSMSFSDGVAAFSAETRNPGDIGIWTAHNGTIERLADSNTTYCYANCGSSNPGTINGWLGATISGSTIAFDGSGEFGETGWNGLFLTSASAPALTPILNSTQVLPGDVAPPPPPATPTFYEQPVVDGGNVFFIATDPNFKGSSATCGGAFWGIFETTTGGGAMTSVANTCDTLPGITQLNAANSFESLAASGSIAIFEVADSAGQQSGYSLYSSANGKLTPVVQSGQTLSDGVVSIMAQPGTNSIDGSHVVFEATFTGQPYSAIYLASVSCGIRRAANVSVTVETPQYDPATGTYSQTAAVTNLGRSPIEGPVALVLEGLTDGVRLAYPAIDKVCLAPMDSPLVSLPLPPDNTLRPGDTATAKLRFANPLNRPIVFAPSVAASGIR